MAYFECVIGSAASGGSGADLIVTCDSVFAGATITCTDGNTTFTETCPSSSPYTVTFESIPTGTWTISGVHSGQTFSVTKTITDFTETLIVIPDGATVTPTDDIQTWLHCAGIFDKTYTTISQVLNDATTVTALIASNNAADYMARSTTWASSVCANSSAMTKIGANNYCADKLLANSTWLNAIANSSYIESVLNVKIPTMTSNSAPSGQVFAQTVFSSFLDYYSVDGNNSTLCILANTSGKWGYCFPTATKVRVFKFTEFGDTSQVAIASVPKNYTIEGSNNGTNYTVLKTVTNQSATVGQTIKQVFVNNTSYKYYRLNITANNGLASYTEIGKNVQFYGRA